MHYSESISIARLTSMWADYMKLTENTLLTNHNNPVIQKNNIVKNENLENLTWVKTENMLWIRVEENLENPTWVKTEILFQVTKEHPESR